MILLLYDAGNMRRLNSMNVLRKLKKTPNLQNITAVFCSTFRDRDQKRQCDLLSARGSMTKPCSFSEIIDIAQYLIDFIRETESTPQWQLNAAINNQKLTDIR